MNEPYAEIDPPRAGIDATPGPLLLVFGSNGCGICRGSQPLLVAAMAGQDWLEHLKIQDGPGLKLGRSFRVKLWPTLIFMQDGKEVARVVRPDSVAAITEAITLLRAT